MCLVALAWQVGPRYRLVVAANRDELYARETAPAQYWHDAPDLVAGRDLVQGGTWLGVTRSGRFAAVTNVRERRASPPEARSRGHLAASFLRGQGAAVEYAERAVREGSAYAGFNLLVADDEHLVYCSNRSTGPRVLAAGTYALSNHLLDTPWPKVERAREAFARALAEAPGDALEGLFDVLADRTVPPDTDLPDTGIGIERERLLAPIFIATPIYGTRSSTVVAIGRDGRPIRVLERTHDPEATSESRSFTIAPEVTPR